MSRIFRDIFCGHFPWKLKDENLRNILPKFFADLFEKFRKNFALGIAGTTFIYELGEFRAKPCEFCEVLGGFAWLTNNRLRGIHRALTPELGEGQEDSLRSVCLNTCSLEPYSGPVSKNTNNQNPPPDRGQSRKSKIKFSKSPGSGLKKS